MTRNNNPTTAEPTEVDYIARLAEARAAAAEAAEAVAPANDAVATANSAVLDLRAKARRGGNVKPAELGTARAAIELAELYAEGAEARDKTAKRALGPAEAKAYPDLAALITKALSDAVALNWPLETDPIAHLRLDDGRKQPIRLHGMPVRQVIDWPTKLPGDQLAVLVSQEVPTVRHPEGFLSGEVTVLIATPPDSNIAVSNYPAGAIRQSVHEMLPEVRTDIGQTKRVSIGGVSMTGATVRVQKYWPEVPETVVSEQAINFLVSVIESTGRDAHPHRQGESGVRSRASLKGTSSRRDGDTLLTTLRVELNLSHNDLDGEMLEACARREFDELGSRAQPYLGRCTASSLTVSGPIPFGRAFSLDLTYASRSAVAR